MLHTRKSYVNIVYKCNRRDGCQRNRKFIIAGRHRNACRYTFVDRVYITDNEPKHYANHNLISITSKFQNGISNCVTFEMEHKAVGETKIIFLIPGHEVISRFCWTVKRRRCLSYFNFWDMILSPWKNIFLKYSCYSKSPFALLLWDECQPYLILHSS